MRSVSKSYLWTVPFILLPGAALPPQGYEAIAIVEFFPPERENPAAFHRLEAARFRSRPVMEAAVRDPKLCGVVRGKTIHELEGKIAIDWSRPNFLTIRVTGDDSYEPLVLLKAILGAYVTEAARQYGNPPPVRIVEEPEVRKRNGTGESTNP